MFKNLQLYKIIQAAITEDFAEALEARGFVPCGASQEKSVGWVPPRGGEHDEFAPVIGGHTILKLTTEVKTVPGDVLQRKVDEQVAHIEQTTGRKPGKKERREIKEDAKLALLPMAFSKRSSTLIWVNSKDNYIAIDASSQSKADDAITELIKALDGLALQLVNTNVSPASCMAQWLVEQEPSHGFTIDRECELKACDESKAVVKYGRHPLDIEEVAQHIRLGKMPTKLALTWNDRVSFVLTEGMALKKLTFLDLCFEDSASKGDHAEDHFDADVAIATGELSKLIPDLLEALGGEVAA
ncbi:recombination-associated protein RdgC [Rhodoferax sp. TH121]|uniref:recombination-associated protein RdgC n=1 Tax=Rhodoferax sp. TH121 TaxID=2022803 RepID=UPI000B9674ED|nr:recombination-associated protein RdgC [Rhodoferax sp. TH121]OYQ41062.1 recombination-associated protein RdgC [Rhodoferax sp. TH121]